TLTWTYGTMNGVGSTSVAAGAVFNLGGTQPKNLDTRTFNNAGTATWTGTSDIYLSNGAQFNNSGTFDAQNNQRLLFIGGAPPSFNNSGTFRKSAGAGTTYMTTAFNNVGATSLLTGTVSF